MPGNSIHTIMVPVRGDGKGDNVLAHAAVLARKFGSRVRVVHCHLTTRDMMPYGVAIPRIVREQIEAATRQNVELNAEQLTAEFRELAARFGLSEEDHQPGKATARFIDYEGKQVDAVRHLGRMTDLICVPQPDRSLNLGQNTLKTALFSSGRPVMMCPHNDPVREDFAERIAIGWNGSLEATRAVAMTMPFLASAEQVTILWSGPSGHAATADELQRYLELKNIGATVRQFAPKKNVVGEQLLEEAEAAGCGMLVMGAYHDSYERESVFGGNSQAVVDKATYPVVLVH